MLKKRQKDTISFNFSLKNRKGLSAIVATLIIILLVLVAAGIIWVVVRSLVQEGAEGIELGKFTLDLEIKRAQIGNGDVTVVVVRRNPGQGNYIGMNFVFSDGINSEIIRENTTLQELEERSFTFTLTEISTSNLKTISVAPIFELSSGKESVGDIADSFDVPLQIGGDGEPIGNFEMLGSKGMGNAEYTISSSEGVLPEFKRAIVDPLDVPPGYNQTFTTHVYSPYSVINVTSVTELDNSTLYLDFEKIDEYVENNETIEIWSASWIVYDTHVNIYRTTIIARDVEGNENNITLTWTDSCSGIFGNQGGDATISVNCLVGTGQVAGLDGGHLTIAGGTLTLNPDSTWAFNPGKSIFMTGSGKIAMNGGSIKPAYLFYIDADGDNYAASSTMSYHDTTTYAGKIRVGSGSLLGVADCYDKNANAKLGQINNYTTTRGTSAQGNDAAGHTWNSYDYNCWGGDEKQWTTFNGECEDCDEIWNDEPMCEDVGTGNIGWESASAPACGVPGSYITEPGWCDYGSACQNTDCIDVPRTQACR